MDMSARNQYLKVLQGKYFMAKSRKEKSSILDEYYGNTGQNRKYVIRKLNSSISLVPKRRVSWGIRRVPAICSIFEMLIKKNIGFSKS